MALGGQGFSLYQARARDLWREHSVLCLVSTSRDVCLLYRGAGEPRQSRTQRKRPA